MVSVTYDNFERRGGLSAKAGSQSVELDKLKAAKSLNEALKKKYSKARYRNTEY
jgi:hypothetical protein